MSTATTATASPTLAIVPTAPYRSADGSPSTPDQVEDWGNAVRAQLVARGFVVDHLNPERLFPRVVTALLPLARQLVADASA